MRKWLMFVLCMTVMGFGVLFVRGQADRPATAPATQPEAAISPAAKAVLDDLGAAYSKLKTLDLAGQIKFELDAADEKSTDTSEFTASYEAPGKFRHQMKDDVLVVSNGEQVYLYQAAKKIYASIEAPKQRTNGEDLAAPLGMLFERQNPSLLLAISKDPAAELIPTRGTIDRGEDVTIDGTRFISLNIRSSGRSVRMLVHPQTHLLRQIRIDLKETLIARGVPKANMMQMTLDYTKSAADGVNAADAFSWTPPADAMMTKIMPEEAAGGAGGEEAALALVGKDAPAFTLKDMKDQEVKLSSTKGKVVVLDFWATWCGPCVVSLPHMDALNKSMSGRGVVVYAVNQGEPKDVVKKFLDEKKLSLPVLLDSDSEVGQLYKASGIPQTVVIGKDGKIQKVFVGYGPGMEDEIRQIVEAALK